MQNSLSPTFSHQTLQYSLTCTLTQPPQKPSQYHQTQTSSQLQNLPQSLLLPKQQPYLTLSDPQSLNSHSLHIHMMVPTDTFPRVYTRTIDQAYINGRVEMCLIFETVVGLYRALKDQANIEVQVGGPEDGKNGAGAVIKVKYGIRVGDSSDEKSKCKYVDIKLDRSLQNQLQQIRNIINQKTQTLTDLQHLQTRVQKLWVHQQQNQKIFLKYKQQTQFRLEQSLQRISIQNTKITLLQQDVHKLTKTVHKLTNIICPIFSRINIMTDWTEQFIMQDKKIVYVGEAGLWTQLMWREELGANGGRRGEISFKIVNSRRCNVVAGFAAPSQYGLRSSLSAAKGERNDRKFIGLSGTGQLYMSSSSSDSQLPQPKSLTSSKHQSQKPQRNRSKSRQKPHHPQQQKKPPTQQSIQSIPSPILKSSIFSKGPSHSTAHSNPNHNGNSNNSNNNNNNNELFKPMQIIKMCIEADGKEKDRERVVWRNGNRVLMEVKVGGEFKGEDLVPWFQFWDTGDAIQFVDF